MNKRVVALFGILIAVFIILWLFNNKKSPAKDDRSAPISVAKNSSSFNNSFQELLSAYYLLKDALVASDTLKANQAAAILGESADSLQISEIKADSTGTIKETARYFTGSISGSASGLAQQNDIEGKRKEFEVITESVWSLMRTVKYDGEKVYYQYCPMAFNNKGAYWLSNNNQIRNPYFGDKMLKCGEIADSLDYSNQ